MEQYTDTIAAIATPVGFGGIGIIRISGPQTKEIAQQIIKEIPTPRFAHFCEFYDENNAILDQGIALYFSAPNSFTGEDVLELQGHGGVTILNIILQRILSLGARMAEPGEFSLRAYLNHKIDLIQAESICDLIQASSTQAAKAAIQSLQGVFSQKINSNLKELIALRVQVEAMIDFPEEEIEPVFNNRLLEQLYALYENINEICSVAAQGKLLREGLIIAIAGKPNVGKSTLLNQLCGEEIAIVSSIAGTTRDLIREHCLLDGVPVQLIDTAGIHETNDVIEQEGIKRARNAIENAQLTLILLEASVNAQVTTAQEIQDLLKNNELGQNKILVVKNKIDLVQQNAEVTEENDIITICLSAKTGAGIDLLKQQIKLLLGIQNNSEGVYSARSRHITALQKAKEHLTNALTQFQQSKAYELLAEDLRLCQAELNKITGEFGTEDLLGEIFSTFCIGK